MKKFFSLIVISFIALVASAQSNNVILKEIPRSLDIRDKIIVQNNTPFQLDKVVIIVANRMGGVNYTCENLSPSTRRSVADFGDNRLSSMKGQILAIKAKGHRNVNGQDEVTYDFDAFYEEESHDLYIKLFYKGVEKNSVMDF